MYIVLTGLYYMYDFLFTGISSLTKLMRTKYATDGTSSPEPTHSSEPILQNPNQPLKHLIYYIFIYLFLYNFISIMCLFLCTLFAWFTGVVFFTMKSL